MRPDALPENGKTGEGHGGAVAGNTVKNSVEFIAVGKLHAAVESHSAASRLSRSAYSLSRTPAGEKQSGNPTHRLSRSR